jgi:hypothetical protein
MRAIAIVLAVCAALAGGSASHAKPSGRNAPNLAACRHIEQTKGTEISRTAPLEIPAAWSGIARADMWRIAFSTLGGRTYCVDASWIEQINDPELSADGRFIGFEWIGYEIGGYFMIDRSGKGTMLETGDRPIMSPGGSRAAVVQYSGSDFGTLEGFGVWHVGKPPMRELARLYFAQGLTDWRMEGWRGETCVLISAARFEDLPQAEAEEATAPRQPYVAFARKRGWEIAPGADCPTP